jgi:hypothetical protein
MPVKPKVVPRKKRKHKQKQKREQRDGGKDGDKKGYTVQPVLRAGEPTLYVQVRRGALPERPEHRIYSDSNYMVGLGMGPGGGNTVHR